MLLALQLFIASGSKIYFAVKTTSKSLLICSFTTRNVREQLNPILLPQLPEDSRAAHVTQRNELSAKTWVRCAAEPDAACSSFPPTQNFETKHQYTAVLKQEEVTVLAQCFHKLVLPGSHTNQLLRGMNDSRQDLP